MHEPFVSGARVRGAGRSDGAGSAPVRPHGPAEAAKELHPVSAVSRAGSGTAGADRRAQVSGAFAETDRGGPSTARGAGAGRRFALSAGGPGREGTFAA